VTNPKCRHYEVIRPNDKANCPNCYHWDINKGKRKDHAMLVMYEDVVDEDFSEVERLMKHDSFRREHGGIRQIRHGI